MVKSGASIQGDKEFVKIHHTILEVLAKAPLTGGELRCLLWLLRKTYGWNKKEDKISLSQWEEGTGMKRQNVWSILQSLLKRNVIYTKSAGPKRAATWGFNKYYETWVFDSVMPEHDTSVMPEHDSLDEEEAQKVEKEDQSVMPRNDRSVIPPHEHTKDNKDKHSLLADSDDSMALMRLAYQTVNKFGPPTSTETGKETLALASDLIDTYGFLACHRMIGKLEERHNALIKQGKRLGISAPIAYLKTLMDNDESIPVCSPAVLDFAVEELIP